MRHWYALSINGFYDVEAYAYDDKCAWARSGKALVYADHPLIRRFRKRLLAQKETIVWGRRELKIGKVVPDAKGQP